MQQLIEKERDNIRCTYCICYIRKHLDLEDNNTAAFIEEQTTGPSQYKDVVLPV